MNHTHDMSRELNRYLHPGEELLWSGRPTRAEMSKNAVFPAIFSVFFMAFAVFWMSQAAMAGGVFFLFGIPFLFIGGFLFYKTTFGHQSGLKNTIYGVTESRAIIITRDAHGATNVKEYLFSELSGVNLENVKDNVGTVRFEDVNVHNYYDYGTYGRRRGVAYYPDRELTTAFIMIEDVHRVYHLISEHIEK